jgi:hypothetical protein
MLMAGLDEEINFFPEGITSMRFRMRVMGGIWYLDESVFEI